MKKEDQSLELLGEPTIVILSPPPPFLPGPGEPAIPWDRWRKSFEQYLEAFSDMNLDNSSKCALLQNCLGHEGQRVYRTLIQGEASYTAAIFTLTIHFTSNDNPQVVRFKFRQRAQKPGESMEQFVSDLQELVKPCNYGDFEHEFILDQLIEKTSCIHLKEKLLFGQRTMTLANALIIAKQVEYSISHSASPSNQNMTRTSEEVPHWNGKDLNDQEIAGVVRTKDCERRRTLRVRKTKTLPGLNKDKNYYYEDDEQYGENESQTSGFCDGNDDTGMYNIKDEDHDYEVGEKETDEDRDFDGAKNKHCKVKNKGCDVAADEEVTSSSMEKKEHVCPICTDKSFRHSSKLTRHMMVHTRGKPFNCPVCAMAFTRSDHMNRHFKNKHNVYPETKDKEKNCEVESDETEKHDYNVAKSKDGKVNSEAMKEKNCDDAKSKDGDVNSEAIKEKDCDDAKSKNGDVDSEAIKEKDCDDAKSKNGDVDSEAIKEKDCDDATDDSHEANGSNEASSSTTVNNKLCCLICTDRYFRCPSHLARHMRGHTKERPFSCPVCATVFTQSYHMVRHLRVKHEDYNNAQNKDYEVAADDLTDKHVGSGSENSDGPGDEVFSPSSQKRERRPIRLARQMMTHSKEKPRCSVCGMSFFLAEHLTKHIKNKHRGCHICRKCGESFGNSADLKTHFSIHARKALEKLPCPVCNNKFHGTNALIAHMKAHGTVPPSSRGLTCYICAKRFPRMYSLKRHLTTHGAEFEHHLHQQNQRNRLGEPKMVTRFTGSREKPHVCAVCGRRFTYQYALKNHEKKHVEAPFHCSKCNKLFTERAIFERHQLIHVRRQSKCPHCEGIITKSFKSHLRTHVKERPYQCSCCVESFTQEEHLELHCLKHKKFKKEKPYSCTRCSYAFTSIKALTEHMVIHKGEQAMNCPDCGCTFLNKSKLEKHMSIHNGENSHLCAYCGRSFLSSTTLKFHMRTHTGEKPFKCSQCSKSYVSSSGLKAHGRQHMAVRPSYPCSDCGRKYGRVTELKIHQRSHTGDKPYVCNVCSKRFVIKDKLNVHMRIHTGERPYGCSHCGQTFTQSGDRNRHIKRYHK